MAKRYALDGALLTEKPGIEIGDKIYAVDNRKSTVEKVMKLSEKSDNEFKEESFAILDKTIELILGGKALNEIQDMDMPYPAFQKLFELVMAAATGEEPEAVAERFQEEKQKA